MEVIELSNVPVVPAPTFEVGEFVREGDWACEVLAPACGRGFYPVRRILMMRRGTLWSMKASWRLLI
ncbi:MAG: hypothetical protein JJ911_07770 [Rhizobiaceae bacterium]|nr:hypothetical protein [Rhizobiaceae bacterium]